MRGADTRGLVAVALIIVMAGCASTAASPAANGTRGAGTPESTAVPPQLAAIRENELRSDIFFLASDTMRGREAGTLDELRASM